MTPGSAVSGALVCLIVTHIHEILLSWAVPHHRLRWVCLGRSPWGGLAFFGLQAPWSSCDLSSLLLKFISVAVVVVVGAEPALWGLLCPEWKQAFHPCAPTGWAPLCPELVGSLRGRGLAQGRSLQNTFLKLMKDWKQMKRQPRCCGVTMCQMSLVLYACRL